MTVILDMDPAADSEPIRGVDLERYAQLCAGMLRSGVTRPEAIERFAVDHGIAPGDWQMIQDGWIERLNASEDLRVRYRDAATPEPPAERQAGT